jgi:hypothetical protein
MNIYLLYSKGETTGRHLFDLSEYEAILIMNAITAYVENTKDKRVRNSKDFKATQRLLKKLDENVHFSN